MTEKVSTELRQICRIITETVEVEKIYLFGSHAYGTVSSTHLTLPTTPYV